MAASRDSVGLLVSTILTKGSKNTSQAAWKAVASRSTPSGGPAGGTALKRSFTFRQCVVRGALKWREMHLRGSLPGPVALETQNGDLRFADVGRHGRRNVAGRHGNLLRAVGRIGDHSAADRAADLLTPQLLAGGGVERIEVAAHVAKEHEASGSRRHGAEDRIIGLQSPLPYARVVIDGVKPSRPDTVGARELSHQIKWIQGLLCDPRLPDRGRQDFVPGLQLHRRAPVDVAGEDEIGHGVVRRAVPFLPAPGA